MKLITWLLQPLRIFFKFRASRGSAHVFKLISSSFPHIAKIIPWLKTPKKIYIFIYISVIYSVSV